MIPIFIGYDPSEAASYSVLAHSLTRLSTQPLTICPINLGNLPFYQEQHTDGSTQFSYSRFLVPYLMGYAGWAIYMDCDMLALADISELWSLRDDALALQCAQHSYKTKQQTKFWARANADYPRKNWSSLMLLNCAHPSLRVLTPEFVSSSTGDTLHQFKWLEDQLIGSLPLEWNWLADEYGSNPEARLVHYTLGSPCIEGYEDTPMSDLWFKERAIVNGR